jgi:predicted TIM-barrel fold metal-dependent hydrolase
LTNLFLEYPEARFICLHGGYPYSRGLGALARMFKNVFIEMSWIYHFSSTAARSSLSEWLECVPIDQILAFGGDATNVEVAYGTSVVARECITGVLAEKVEDHFYTLEEAGLAAQRILRENAMELFRLSSRI